MKKFYAWEGNPLASKKKKPKMEEFLNITVHTNGLETATVHEPIYLL